MVERGIRSAMQGSNVPIHNPAVSAFVFFFFQAEDGIRDLTVTGVQTCALPISKLAGRRRCTYTWGGTPRTKPKWSASAAAKRPRHARPLLNIRLSSFLGSPRDRKSVV